MASTSGAVWAIEIGNDTLKALHLRLAAADTAEVIGFDSISYGKVLNAEGLKESEKDELIALALRNFLRQNPIGKDDVIIPVPSQNSFARFVNLPPVEEKKIPQVVKLEAGMQIPFDINDVQWDWQLMSEKDASEARVGIFAVKNDVINKEMDYFANEDIPVNIVQMTPMALYNYVVYDRPELVKSDSRAVMVINIGSENTDLVICTKSAVWQRCMPMGGNAFTRAISDTFKLNFSKAEKLKRTAAMSKYARQVFQAMRPVFSDFVAEIQRSIGFYTNSNPNTKLVNIIAMGGGTKLRGLLKYIQQSLQIPVEKPDTFKNIVLNPQVSAAKFHENVGDFGVVYGLALQGLGLSSISVNLLPKTVAKTMMWNAKAKYFTYAAIALLVVSAMAIGRTILDGMAYKAKKNVRSQIMATVEVAQTAREELQSEQARAVQSETVINKTKSLFRYKDVVPKVCYTVLSVMPNANNTPSQQELYKAFNKGDIENVIRIPRNQRKQVFVTGMSLFYSPDVEKSNFTQPAIIQTTRRTPTLQLDPLLSKIYDGGGLEDMEGAGREMETGPATEQKGFVITLTGYTPYEKYRELLDPAGAEDDQGKWGVVTRLMNLDKIQDGNSIFELYKKTEVKHFEIVWKEVTVDGQMPLHIGIREKLKTTERGKDKDMYVIKDPMTKEIMSMVPQVDEMGREKVDRRGNILYQPNDHWFILKFKLVWKENLPSAPAPEYEENDSY